MINESFLKLLRTKYKTKNCFLVGASGSLRIGKSFLLCLLSKNDNDENPEIPHIFESGCSEDSITEGYLINFQMSIFNSLSFFK